MNPSGRLLVVLLLFVAFSLPSQTAADADPAKSQDCPPGKLWADIMRLGWQTRVLGHQIEVLQRAGEKGQEEKFGQLTGRLTALQIELGDLTSGLLDFKNPQSIHGTVNSVSNDGGVAVTVGPDDTPLKGSSLAVSRIIDGKRRFVAWLEVLHAVPGSATCKVTYMAGKLQVEQGDPVVAPPREGCPDHTVLAVQGDGLVEVSIGSDDGLEKGALLSIYSADGSRHLGKVEAVTTKPDRAVCKILADTQTGAIGRHDLVRPPRRDPSN